VGSFLVAVKTQADPFYAAVFELEGFFFCEKRAVYGDDETEALFIAVIDNVEDVIPHKWFSSGEDYCRGRKGKNVVNDVFAFIGGELTHMGAKGCGRPAVDATEVTVSR
jgi:hypothetical protein